MLRVVHAASEIEPWCKTGGLADVASALPAALARSLPDGSRVVVLAPLHRGVEAVASQRGVSLVDAGWALWPLGEGGPEARILLARGAAGRHEIGFVQCASLFDRAGPYDDGTTAFSDNPLRFAAFTRAVAEVGPALVGGPPDIAHAHDWHAGLLPLQIRQHESVEVRRAWAGARSVFTIHNLLYQGVCDKSWVERLGLRWADFGVDGFEWHDQLSFLKAGVAFSDATTTVSPTYAREITTAERGEGLEGLFRSLGPRLRGILNGIDTEQWDPATDTALTAPFSADALHGRRACRAALLDGVGLPEQGRPILGVVSRLVWNKGLDTVAWLGERLMDLGIQLVVLGSGDRDLSDRFVAMARRWPGRVAVRVGFDGILARRIFAGSDLFAVPSRTEPCGLTQMQALRYGAVPVVHSTGGLADTVRDAGEMGQGSGFVFSPHGPDELHHALGRAVELWREDPEGWRRVQSAGMQRDWSWREPAAEYAALYRELLGGAAAPRPSTIDRRTA